MRRLNSLWARLFLTAAVWSTLALAMAAFILTTLYRQSVERAFDERLGVYVMTLVGAMASDPESADPVVVPGNIGEPRFGLPLSGWYWLVQSLDDRKDTYGSESLVGDTLHLPDRVNSQLDGQRSWRGYIIGPGEEELRVLTREISFGEGGVYRIAVAGDADDVSRDVAAFRYRVAITLAIFGLGLIIALIFQVRIGLRPLERLRQALLEIRAGRADHLKGSFPREIEPLAAELNALIESNREVVERARTHVGNLAHALKTPLSVIINEARRQDGPLADKVVGQTEQMRDQIARHLERARIAAQRRTIGSVTDLEPVVHRLVRTMRHIHENKGIAIDATIAPDIKFRGEQPDLEEMLGNLVDNACKWADTGVTVTIAPEPDGSGDRPMLRVMVDDDGPGLSPEMRSEATKRGRRLDETVPGSGLGLSIVNELTRLYAGRFILDSSPTGGLRAILILPMV